MDVENRAHRSRVNFEHAIRQLHASGASLREIGDALELSHQRVHQIVDPSMGKGALRRGTAKGLEPCSFCGTPRAEVSKLIAGPRVLICERCVDLARQVLEGGERENERTKLMGLGPRHSKSRCSFCGKRRPQVSGMAEAPLRPGVGKYARRSPGVRVCGDCLALCVEILEERQRN